MWVRLWYTHSVCLILLYICVAIIVQKTSCGDVNVSKFPLQRQNIIPTRKKEREPLVLIFYFYPSSPAPEFRTFLSHQISILLKRCSGEKGLSFFIVFKQSILFSTKKWAVEKTGFLQLKCKPLSLSPLQFLIFMQRFLVESLYDVKCGKKKKESCLGFNYLIMWTSCLLFKFFVLLSHGFLYQTVWGYKNTHTHTLTFVCVCVFMKEEKQSL